MPSKRCGIRYLVPFLLLVVCLVIYYVTQYKEDFPHLQTPLLYDVPAVETSIGAEMHTSSFGWQQIFKDFYFYSIYPTVNSDEIHATIIGPRTNEPIRKFWKLTVCDCVYHSDNDEPRSLVKGFVEPSEDFDDKNLNMMAGRVRSHSRKTCKVPRASIPLSTFGVNTKVCPVC
jgi:hypothetical protein